MRTILLIGFLLSFYYGQAQPKTQVIGWHSRYGQIYQHSKDLKKYNFGTLNPRGIELTYHIRTDGSKAWHQPWRFPEWGVSLHWNQLDNSEILGDAIGATVYLQKFILDKPSHALSYKFAPGMVWISKQYHPTENPHNFFVSTPINFIMETNLLYHYKFSPKWRLNIGGFVTHYSNGAIRLPNRGYNMYGIIGGMAYTIHADTYQRKTQADVAFTRKWHIDVNLAHGLKSPKDGEYKQYYAGVFSGYVNRRLNPKSGLTLGTDLFYHTSIQAQINSENPVNPWRVGIQSGHELYISRVSLLTQMGVYVYRPVAVDKYVYWRAGIKYYVTPSIFVGMLLKAHFGQADIIEWGTGVRIK